jgi:spore photoproduct lyase
MECSYCFLQWYLDMPCVVVYANHLALLAELDEFLSERRGDFLRIGTGELADSLALDSLTEYCALLVEFFARQPNAVLELKTKSDFVDNLLGLDHGRRTVPAWSVNPRSVQEANEHKTASITARFRAARKCVEAGYQVAFHFDPMIHYPGWETAYRLLVEEIFDTVDPSSVAWLSMGGLRMTPPLKETIRRRFPRSLLPFGELLPGDDGKMRYFKPIRVEMYRKALSWIRAVAPRVPVYLCMEKPEVWFRVFGSTAPDERELQNIICARLAD